MAATGATWLEIADQLVYRSRRAASQAVKRLLSGPVVVTTTSVDEALEAPVSEVGVPIPDDLTTVGPAALDPAVWKTPHQDLAALRRETD